MKTATAGLLTGILGIVSFIVHPMITAITLLGTGLASTPETPVPALTETLWGISLWGTLAAVIAFFALMLRWSKPLAIVYAFVWLALVGCYAVGCLINGSTLPQFLIIDGVLPLSSAGLAIYGVWRHHAGTENA